jgi:cyanophycinase-like exopeptidase
MKPLTLTVPLHLLVLIGGGEFSFGETAAVDEFLVAQLGPNRTIAFLPTASGSAEYAVHLGAHFKTLDPRIETINVPIYRGRDNRRQKNLDQILGAGMIYAGGGLVSHLLATIRESPAELALRDAAAGGAIVAAIGASASAFGSYVRDGRPALGWLDGTVIEPAFDPTNDTSLRRLMSLPDVRLGLGIPAGTALAVRSDGTADVVGEGTVAAFRK